MRAMILRSALLGAVLGLACPLAYGWDDYEGGPEYHYHYYSRPHYRPYPRVRLHYHYYPPRCDYRAEEGYRPRYPYPGVGVRAPAPYYPRETVLPVILGGVIGGVLGHEASHGDGFATAVGSVAGAVIGHELGR